MRLFIFGLAIFLASCSAKQPFTQNIRQEYKLTKDELKQIQFYTDANLLLSKVPEKQLGKKAESGVLSVQTTSNQNSVLIKANTPGRVVKIIDAYHLAVSFDSDDKSYLVYKRNPTTGVYNLRVLRNKRGESITKYGNEMFLIKSSENRPRLVFKMKKFNSNEQIVQVAKGNKI